MKGIKFILESKKVFHSLLFKFIFSISLVTVFNVSVIGFTSYMYFSNKFNKEIAQFNTYRIKQLKNTIDSVYFRKVDFLSIDLLLHNLKNENLHFLLNHPFSENYSKIYFAKDALRSISLTDNRIIDSISIYYKDNNMIISSTTGARFINDNSISTPIDTNWIDLFNSSTSSKNYSLWLKTRKSPLAAYNPASSNNNIITFIRTIPLASKFDNFKGLLAISIKESIIRQTISSLIPDKFSTVLIVTEKGDIITQNNPQQSFKNIKETPYFYKINNATDVTFLIDIDNVKTVVTSIKSNYNNWYYVYMVSADQYYRKTFIIKQIILAICSLSLLLSLVLSNLFSFKLTNPFSKIVKHSRDILSNQNIKLSELNEIKIIDKTINLLSKKATDLEIVLSKNRQMITKSFYFNLINDRFYRKDELEKRLDFINIKFSFPYFCVILIRFNFNAINKMSIGNSEYIFYDFVNNLNKITLHIIPVIQDRYHIALIFNHSHYYFNKVNNVVPFISDVLIRKYNVVCQFGIGNSYDDIQLTAKSFEEAKNAIKYSFIYPNTMIFETNKTSQWDLNNSFSIENIDKFTENIKTLKIMKVKEFLENIKEYILKNQISYKNYEYVIKEITLSLEQTAVLMNFNQKEMLGSSIIEKMDKEYYINDLFSSFESIAKLIIDNVKNNRKDKREINIQKAKEFIIENIDKDISLDMVADKLFISPAHLSRIFKASSYEGFITYLTRVRMEKASELLVTKKSSIRTIADEVGFHDYSYFARVFKKHYGQTPNQYKKEKT